MRTSHVVPAALIAFVATAAQAKTEVEMTFDLLSYSDTTSEVSSDDVDTDSKETDLSTVEPAFDLDIYANNVSLRFSVDATDGNDSGTIAVGYGMNPNLYVGGALNLENSKSTETTKPDGGDKSETKTEDNTMIIGPFVHYRDKNSQQMIEAEGILGMLNTKEKTSSDAGAAETESTTKTDAMLLGISGNYRKAVWERVYMGVGLAYTMSLSGDTEVDNGTTTEDADFDVRIIDLTLLDMLVEF